MRMKAIPDLHASQACLSLAFGLNLAPHHPTLSSGLQTKASTPGAARRSEGAARLTWRPVTRVPRPGPAVRGSGLPSTPAKGRNPSEGSIPHTAEGGGRGTGQAVSDERNAVNDRADPTYYLINGGLCWGNKGVWTHHNVTEGSSRVRH